MSSVSTIGIQSQCGYAPRSATFVTVNTANSETKLVRGDWVKKGKCHSFLPTLAPILQRGTDRISSDARVVPKIPETYTVRFASQRFV